MGIESSYGQIVRLPKRVSAPPVASTQPEGPVALTDVLPAQPFDPAATGFILASLPDNDSPVLWIQDHMSGRENGHLYVASLRGFGVNRAILQVQVSHPRDVLWAMEEGAACAGISAVVGEIHGAPPVLDFTATKRLAMRAEVSGVAVFLIRSADPGGLSAARERWRIGTRPSQPHPHDSKAPSLPQWDVELFRARGRSPGRWVAHYDPAAQRATDRFRLVSHAFDRALGQSDQPVSHRSGG